MRNFFLAILVMCASPAFADLWEVHKIVYTPASLDSVMIPGSINKRYFGREGDEKQYYYTGQFKGHKGTVIFLLGSKTWDVIAASILLHETKHYTETSKFYLYRPEELARDIQAAEYRIELSGLRTYTSGSLFDFYRKKFPHLTMIVFPENYVSVWYLKQGQDGKALKVHY